MSTATPETGDLLQQEDALGNLTIYVWSTGLLMSTTDALGRITRYRYNGDRHLSVAVFLLPFSRRARPART